MTTIPRFTRSTRSLAVLGTAAAIVVAGFAAPQMASARVVSNPGYTVCVSTTIRNLVSEGSVVRQRGAQGPGYYTVGGHDFLGTDKNVSKSVGLRAPGVWVAVPLCA